MSRRLFRFVVILPFLFLSGKTQAQRTPHPASIPLQINGQVRYAQGGRPAELVLVGLWYLDAVGMLASAGNRLLLKQGMPTESQILFWDRCLIPL